MSVFVHLGMSLDGFVAGENRSPKNPLGDDGRKIHQWMFELRSFREHLGIAEGGATGPDNDLVEGIFSRIGANIMGKRMFEEGEANWPERAPFGNPVFVLTHEKRASWERPGGTTFHFGNDSLEGTLAKAREAAGGKDVRISGGRDVVVQYLNAGLVDEISIAVSPVLLGRGLRLFDGVHAAFELEETRAGTNVSHLRYRVKRR